MLFTSLFLSTLANLGVIAPQVKAVPPADTTDATVEGIEILRRILVDALSQSASDRSAPQTSFQARLLGRLHDNELVTQLWSGDGTVSHSRGFHLPGEGVFFSLDVGIPLVQGAEPAPEAEEAERDDEWERTKDQVRKGATRERFYGVWRSDALEPQRTANLELDPGAIREIEDVTLRTLARHASRIEGLSQNETITVAFHLVGSGSMPMFVAPEDEERDVHWLTVDPLHGSVEKRLVIRVALSDLMGFGADGTGLDRVRQRARIYEY